MRNKTKFIAIAATALTFFATAARAIGHAEKVGHLVHEIAEAGRPTTSGAPPVGDGYAIHYREGEGVCDLRVPLDSPHDCQHMVIAIARRSGSGVVVHPGDAAWVWFGVDGKLAGLEIVKHGECSGWKAVRVRRRSNVGLRSQIRKVFGLDVDSAAGEVRVLEPGTTAGRCTEPRTPATGKPADRLTNGLAPAPRG